jgi:DNA-binding CsgD family transcriptional regulator
MTNNDRIKQALQSDVGQEAVDLPLSQQDFANWVRALARLPKSAADLMPWIETELKAFFPFRGLFLAHGELVAGEVHITHLKTCGHDLTYVRQVASTFELHLRTSLARWIEMREPFYIDPSSPDCHASQFELAEIAQFGLRNIAAHGVMNARANAGTYFSFAGVSEPVSSWHLNALRLSAPVLNELFLSLVVKPRSSQALLATLTPRQLAIVRHVLAYRDDKSIARALDVSEKTVRNQLTAVYDKLGVSKRGALIALLR